MRMVLANITSGTSNPGCQGTVHCLVEGLRREGGEIISNIPIGYAFEVFARCFTQPPVRSRLQRLSHRLTRVFQPPAGVHQPKICPMAWEKAVERMRDRLAPSWQSADLLVVNGEGTIHHCGVGAMVLVGLCAAARRMGKKVALVNCSITELDDFLLESLRTSVDYLSVREPVTSRYLEGLGMPPVLAADCLFLAGGEPGKGLGFGLPSGGPHVLYTPGVLTSGGQIDAATISSDISLLRQLGHSVLYFIVEAEDEPLAVAAAQAGASILPLGCIPWDQMPALLAEIKLVVSGRYHVNIFAALAGVPFLPMETNTSKMQGLLELLGPGHPVPVRNWRGENGKADPLDLDRAFAAPPAAVARCAALARNNFDLLRQNGRNAAPPG